MEIKRCNSPVTVQSEQATAYAAAEGNNKDLLETVKWWKKKGVLSALKEGFRTKVRKLRLQAQPYRNQILMLLMQKSVRTPFKNQRGSPRANFGGYAWAVDNFRL